jgi:hypothetical protein
MSSGYAAPTAAHATPSARADAETQGLQRAIASVSIHGVAAELVAEGCTFRLTLRLPPKPPA